MLVLNNLNIVILVIVFESYTVGIEASFNVFFDEIPAQIQNTFDKFLELVKEPILYSRRQRRRDSQKKTTKKTSSVNYSTYKPQQNYKTTPNNKVNIPFVQGPWAQLNRIPSDWYVAVNGPRDSDPLRSVATLFETTVTETLPYKSKVKIPFILEPKSENINRLLVITEQIKRSRYNNENNYESEETPERMYKITPEVPTSVKSTLRTKRPKNSYASPRIVLLM